MHGAELTTCMFHVTCNMHGLGTFSMLVACMLQACHTQDILTTVVLVTCM